MTHEKPLRCLNIPGTKYLKLISWNILADTWADPRDYQSHVHKLLPWTKRRKRIQHWISQWKPDILCLQEVSISMYRHFHLQNMKMSQLHAHLPHHWQNNNTLKTYPANGQMTAWNAKKFTLCGEGTFPLSSNGNQASYVILNKIKDHTKWIIINIHLEDEDYQIQQHQLSTLQQQLRLLQKQIGNKAAIVVAGDFNHILSEKWWHQHGFDISQVKQGTDWCSSQIIDYVCVSGHASIVSSQLMKRSLLNSSNISKCQTQTLQTYGTDHYAVFCKIRYNRKVQREPGVAHVK